MSTRLFFRYLLIFFVTLIYLAFIAPMIVTLVNIPTQIFFIGSSILVFFYLHVNFKLFFNSYQLSKLEISLIFITYFITLFYLLFLKNSEVIDASTLDFIPLFFSHPTSSQFILLIGNIVMFMPIGYLSREYKITQSIFFIIILSFIIETSQFIFKVGVFDLSDILLYCIGFTLGYIYSLVFYRISKEKDNLGFDIMLVFSLIIFTVIICIGISVYLS